MYISSALRAKEKSSLGSARAWTLSLSLGISNDSLDERVAIKVYNGTGKQSIYAI